MEVLSETGRRLLALLECREISDPRFKGRLPDISRLTPVDLGRLLPIARTLPRLPPSHPAQIAAFHLEQHARLVEPSFCPEDARAILRLAKPPEPTTDEGAGYSYLSARFLECLSVIAGCLEELPDLPELIDPLLPIVEASDPRPEGEPASAIGAHGWLLLASFGRSANAERLAQKIRASLAGSPLELGEIDLMLGLPMHDAVALARAASVRAMPRADSEVDAPGSYRLGGLTGYLAFAREAFSTAIDRVSRIHEGRDPYSADKAFTLAEAMVLERCARTALDRGAPWLEEMLAPLWSKVTLAPGPAKTMPSQSVAIALGRAVVEMPSAAAITAMRGVVAAIRHAGVKKKLGGMLRTAERRLAARPDLLLQLQPGEAIPKSMATAVLRSLEWLYRSSSVFIRDEWLARFLSHREVKAIATRLIWRLVCADGSATSAMPGGKQLVWRLADGTALGSEAASSIRSITLWHPVSASAGERQAWRDHVMDKRVEQPFVQAFRQYYCPDASELDQSSTSMFAGHAVAIKNVMGVARSSGWTLDRNLGFLLRLGKHEFHLPFGQGLYPGCEGTTITSPLDLYSIGRAGFRPEPVALSTVDPIVLSEVLRSVDLLTSVGAFALDPTAMAAEMADARRRFLGFVRDCGVRFPPDPVLLPGHSADVRREVLRRLYARSPDVSVGARHVAVAGHKIHIATARVTRDGDPVIVEQPKVDGLTWLPHDDEVLSAIIGTVHALSGV